MEEMNDANHECHVSYYSYVFSFGDGVGVVSETGEIEITREIENASYSYG
jgi:hypothetical protein